MKLQKTFKESYMKKLRDNVVAGVSIPLYAEESFELDQTQMKSLANVYAPDHLEDKIMDFVSDDFNAAITLYEAYENISPLLASNETFWAYLTHTSLFNYTQLRWPRGLIGSASPNYILNHWFIGDQGPLRNAAASLWWSVHNTIDETRTNKYELTSILFRNYTLRTTSFGAYTLIRHREAMIGILDFIKDNPEIMENHLESRGTFITKYFNRLGAVKQLSCMDREFFFHKCVQLKSKMLSINSRDQVCNDESLYFD